MRKPACVSSACSSHRGAFPHEPVSDPEKNDKAVRDERAVLAALCQGRLLRADWDEALARLATYRFADRVHQLVFDTLREMNTNDARVIHEQLAARLNNKGFPDLDLEGFFCTPSLSAKQVVDLISLLCSLG